MRLILSQLHNLPEGARFTAAAAVDRMAATGETEETATNDMDPRDEAILDARTWTTDRRLMATVINAIFGNTTATAGWEKGKAPKFPIIGPSSWRPEEKKTVITAPNEPADLFDVLRKMGWPGG